jgi:hypothetical protein
MVKASQKPEPETEAVEADAVAPGNVSDSEAVGGWYISSMPLTLSDGRYVKAGETFYSEAKPGIYWQRTGPP